MLRKVVHLLTQGRMRAGYLLLSSSLVLHSACALGSLDLGAKACPCTEGWTCDARINRCVTRLLEAADAGVAPAEEAGRPLPVPPMSDEDEDTDAGALQDASGSEDASSPEADTGPGPCGGTPMTSWWRDADEDGFGDPLQVGVEACAQPSGYVQMQNGADCDDGARLNHPSAAELCDTSDNDCNADTGDKCPDRCQPRVHDGRLYWFCSTPSTWDDAALACKAGNMSLVRIDSSVENDFVRNGANELADRADVWLGGSDPAGAGDWRWPDDEAFWLGSASGSAPGGSYAKWGSGQPSGGEHCVEMRSGSFWNDATCDTLRAFVCERSVL